MAGKTKRGLGSPHMDEDTREDIQRKGGEASSEKQDMGELGRKGGKSQGKENNPGNFANDPLRASDAGRKGGQE